MRIFVIILFYVLSLFSRIEFYVGYIVGCIEKLY